MCSVNAEALKALALSHGANLVGIADISDMEDLAYPHLNRALVIAVRLSDVLWDEIDQIHMPTHPYFHQYRTANAYIDQLLFKVGLEMQAAGIPVVQVAASQSISKNGSGLQALFSHRAAAIRAGLGWIGKSNALVTHAFGPRVRLGTILFQADVQTDLPITESSCGNCCACVKACPAYALTGRMWHFGMVRESIVDARACSEHMHAAYQQIGRGVVCGVCIAVCPYGKKRKCPY